MFDLFASPVTWIAAGAALVAVLYGLYAVLQPSPPPRFAPRDRDSLVESFQAVASGDFGQAAAVLKEAANRAPEEPRHALLHAVVLTRQGQGPQAAAQVEQLLLRDDLDATVAAYAQETLVSARILAGDRDGASQATRRFVAEAGREQDLDRLDRRSRLALAARAYDVARMLAAYVERADKARGRRLQALIFAARAEDRADAGRPEEALKLVRKALARDRDAAPAWALEGQLQLEAGQLERARQSFLEALTREPGYGIAVFPELEEVHIEAGQVADFEAMIHRLLEARPRDPVAMWALGSHLVHRRHLKDGMAALSEAIEAAPDFALARYELLRARAELDGKPGAVQGPPPRSETLCRACGSRDVHGIVRCPRCGQVGTIAFLVAPQARPFAEAMTSGSGI